MPRHSETRLLPWSPEQMFDLVADVQHYPQFLPWVTATRIRSREPELMVADMAVGFRAFRETFTSRVTLDRPRLVHVDYISGPLEMLINDWHFLPADNGHTELLFEVDFKFRSKVLEKMAGSFFREAFLKMVNSFEQRATALYGSNSPKASSVARRRISALLRPGSK